MFINKIKSFSSEEMIKKQEQIKKEMKEKESGSKNKWML